MYSLLKSMTAVLLSLTSLFSLLFKNTSQMPEVYPNESIEVYEELGIPLISVYDSGTRAIIPWDMAVWNGKLYVGGGDYDINAGPVPVMCYDPDTKLWVETGLLPDEQISRFCVIDNKLFITGTDPTESWDKGNYYVLEEYGWETKRVIPDGIHNFDMVSYNGSVFAGLGVEGGYYPISRSDDGGQTFSQVSMYKNGQPVDTYGKSYVRVYDLAVLNNLLYAFFYSNDGQKSDLELYVYNDEEQIFEFDRSVVNELERKKISYDMIRAKVEYDAKLYFTMGVLYSTDDMRSFEKIELPEQDIVCDLYEANGRLYALSGSLIDNGLYGISVWELEESGFVKKFSFKYEAPPMSLACEGDSFYIGMGNYAAENEKNGSVVCITVK